MSRHLNIDGPKAVTVYCASSPTLDKKYVDAAYHLGHALARAGLTVVSGGGRAGLMAAVIDGAMDAGGNTLGILPRFMVDRGWNHSRLSQMIVTETMAQRKQRLAEQSRAVIALPGGCGTLDELFEIITLRQLGLFQGHVVIFNVDGYYDPLRQMLDRSVQEHFMNPDHARLWHFTDSIDDAVEVVTQPIVNRPFSQKLD